MELQSPDNPDFTRSCEHTEFCLPSIRRGRRAARLSHGCPQLPPVLSCPPFPLHPTGPVISCLSQKQPRAIFMLLHIIVTWFYNLFVFISSICLSWDWPLVQHWQTCVWDEQTSSFGRQTEINGTKTALQYIIRAEGWGKKQCENQKLSIYRVGTGVPNQKTHMGVGISSTKYDKTSKPHCRIFYRYHTVFYSSF